MHSEYPLETHIAQAALELFAAQGIKKTTMEEIAHEAGVSRVTVYRYFKDKKGVVRAAFSQWAAFLRQLRDEVIQDTTSNIAQLLDRIEHRFTQFPSGDLLSRTHELRRLYPDVFEELHQVRLNTLNEIFHHLLSMAERQRLLRPEVDPQVVQIVFWEVLVNLIENPKILSLGLSPQELHRAVRDIFLHGILKNECSLVDEASSG